MQLPSQNKISLGTYPDAIAQQWEMLQAISREDAQDLYALTETRSALLTANAIMRQQEERIRALEAAALTDDLTGAFNRRGFTLAMEKELTLARRDNECSGILVMIDVDSFKTINDTWGHSVGDAYLCAVADVLQESIRTSDTVARLGGDEFALLLTRIDEKTGASRLAKLENAFNKRSLVLHERIPLRASFGFAPYHAADIAEDVMRAADLKLYAHKTRNKLKR